MIHHRFVHVIALLVAIVLATSAAAAQAVGGSLVIQEGRTPRGVRYAFLPQPFENTVAVSFSWWDGFAQARPGQKLVGRLAVAWLQAGTERLPEGQFWEELRDDQIGLRLETGNRITSGFFSGPPDKLSVAAERMREVLLTPALSDRSLARLQRRYASNLDQGREVPETLARSALIELLASGNPFLPEVAGASVKFRGAAERLGREDIEAWRRAVLARDTLVVGVAGRATEAAVIAAIDRAFGDLPERADLPPAPTFTFKRDARTVVIERAVSQTSLVLGAGTDLRWADERDHPLNGIALNAFASGPSSRLFRAVRDELGASYGSTAALPMIGGFARYLVINSAVDPTGAAKVLAVLRAEYERFQREGLTAAEFETARARFVNGLEEQARRAGPASGLLRELLRQGRGGSEGPAVLARLGQLTREEVNAHLREHWPEPPLTAVIVAPSADGIAADCVVRPQEEPEICLNR